ncbi:MAG: ABC transporter permease [Anaerolineae bacterium]|nr:MAG: ABC transporter permease [Anaerolineae bacterium]WKZ45407.1 MAG: ABC-2 family transporter protein [Anaerolineales bacterium]
MKKYLSILSMQIINSLAYPGDFVGRSVSIATFIFIFAGLWGTTYTLAGTDTINGLTVHNMIWYFMMAETLELGRPRINRTISEQVKNGEVAYILNKPYNFILYHFSAGLGDGIVRMSLNLIVGSAVAWILAGAPPALMGWLMALVTMIGAWILHFCFMALIGLAAFVVEETNSFELIYQKFVFILGGFLIPLDMFPAWLQKIAYALPFPYMMYAPARLFVKPDMDLFWQMLTGQIIWVVVFVALLSFVYQRSERFLTINGG